MKLDFDYITLGHGSGGILTSKLLDQLIFELLGNEILAEKHDGAFLQTPQNIAFSTDSYVVSPIFFPGGTIGELAINGTVNDLAMCGAVPQYLSLSFIIEEGLETTEFVKIVESIKSACEKAQVKIVTGDTKVVEKGKGDKIFINTSGIGFVMPQANIHLQNITEESVIIVSNSVANHGVAILSVREGLEFETEIVSDTAPLNEMVQTLIEQFGNQIQLLRDPTRGGVATVLNEIAIERNLGVEILEKNIPVEEQVNNACEILGLDPLFVANEGIFIAIVHPDCAEEVIQTLQRFEQGKNARIIGKMTAEHPKKVILQSAIGGNRVITKLIGEQLPRIC